VIKTSLKPNKVPMQPGVVLVHEDCPEIPDPREQKVFRSVVAPAAKLQFAPSWGRCDIWYPASQLARFCASAGPSHWAALHHLMGYHDLEGNKSFKLEYAQGGEGELDRFSYSDWQNSVSRRSTTGLMARFNKGIILWRSKIQKTLSPVHS
jgi:hypothetical protein